MPGPLLWKSVFPYQEDFDPLPLKRPMWWLVGNYRVSPAIFSKWVCLLSNFVEGVVVNFALLWIVGPVEVLYVAWVKTILSSPLYQCTTWVFLDIVMLMVINFLVKKREAKMSHRVGQKFVRTNFVKSYNVSKTIEKYVKQKFIKINNCGI